MHPEFSLHSFIPEIEVSNKINRTLNFFFIFIYIYILTDFSLLCFVENKKIKIKNRILMDGLQKVDLRFLSHRQKLAFWINMYNACIMHVYIPYIIIEFNLYTQALDH